MEDENEGDLGDLDDLDDYQVTSQDMFGTPINWENQEIEDNQVNMILLNVS